MSVQERRERERRELRDRILGAAIEVIATEGYENLSIRKLARRIEYSPRTIYLYFADKEELLRDVVEEGFRRTRAIRSAREESAEYRRNRKGMSPEEILAERVRAHVEAAFSAANVYRAVIAVVFARDYEPGEAQEEILRQTRREIAELVGSEEPDSEPIEVMTMTLFASVRAFTLSLLNRQDATDERVREERVSRFIAFLTTGLKEMYHDRGAHD